MTTGLALTLRGANISPNLGLSQLVSDQVDAAALRLAEPLLRVDPRDVIKTESRPTGAKIVHRAPPNGDPMLFMEDGGCSVGPVTGLYGGKDVFRFTDEPTNDLRVGPKSLNGVSSFSMIGVMHLDAAMFGAGFHSIFNFRRDFVTAEAMLAHQFNGGVDYLTSWSDQGDGGGGNYNHTASPAISLGVPFTYLWQVLPDYSTKLFVSQLVTPIITQSVPQTPEGGSVELMLFNSDGTNVAQQATGGLARAYVYAGDILDTAENQSLAADLLIELKAHFAVP